jgi:hypothetical protein
MRHLASSIALAVVCAALFAVPAAAQPLPRLTISIGGGYQPSTTDFDDRFTFNLNQETASVETAYPIDAGPLFDVGVAVRLWRGLGAGVAVSRFNGDGTVSVTASLPHPLFFQRPRNVSGETSGIAREETGVHIQAQYQLPPFGKLHVVAFGGPSVLDIKQSIVTDVNFTEDYPFDTASFVGVDSRRIAGTANGFNVGADVRWMFTRHIGAGGVIRFTRAKVDLGIDSRTVRVDAGGAQVAVGARLAF